MTAVSQLIAIGFCASMTVDFAYAADAKSELGRLRGCADRRIAEIRKTASIPVPASAPRYYVSSKSGDDAADGRTPETAWRTSARLETERIAPGSFVLFERGGLYRGTVVTSAGVTYTAYGKGPKPVIYGSPENGADPAKWTQTENPCVWAYDIGHEDVGTLVFDEGRQHAIKHVLYTDKETGKKVSMYTGRPFGSYRDLDTDLHFWHDYSKDGTGKLYLYSRENPGTRFKSIEFNVRRRGFAVGKAPGVTIDNFTVKYLGWHGVGALECKDLTVSNCEFGWIGGSIQSENFRGRGTPVRFGNAVEIYGGCENYTVTNCYIYQVYDAGLTQQIGVRENDMTRHDQRNVRYADNVIEKCNYSIEYFLSTKAAPGNPSRIENFVIEDNLMFDAGVGFCEQRPDCGQAAHIKSWVAQSRNRATGYVVRRNAMCRSNVMLAQIHSSLRNADGSSSLPVLTDNVFIGHTGQRFGLISETSRDCETYANGTQGYVNGFGSGNRCLMLPMRRNTELRRKGN